MLPFSKNCNHTLVLLAPGLVPLKVAVPDPVAVVPLKVCVLVPSYFNRLAAPAKPLIFPVIVAETDRAVKVPTLVILGCAAVVRVPPKLVAVNVVQWTFAHLKEGSPNEYVLSTEG